MDALMLEDPDDAEDIFLIERLHLQGSAFDKDVPLVKGFSF